MAQDAQVEIYIGLEMGKIGETIVDDFAQSNDFNRSARLPAAGLMIDAVLSENLLLEFGVAYSPRGARIKIPSPGSSDIDFDLNYVDLPLNVVIQPESFRVFFGPCISFLASSKIEGLDAMEIYEKRSVGLRYGVGMDIGHFAFRVTMINGLSDIFKNPAYKWRSNSIALTVGVLAKKRNKGLFKPEDPLKELRR
jgi:hypothetical protein